MTRLATTITIPVASAAKQENSTRSLRRKGMLNASPSPPLCTAHFDTPPFGLTFDARLRSYQELLRLLPALGHGGRDADGTLKALPSAARELGLEASVYEVQSGAELEARFAAAARDGMQALYVPEAPLFLTRRSEIAAAAASVRLPAIYTFREFVQAGGLMSYGADLPALYQRAAGYVDKILKGAKPGELPLQSSEKFELAVNLKTAKALNLTISEAFLLRADEVIE